MIKTDVFLENQRPVIVKQIKEAKSFILVAMAYFTDSMLFELLLKKAEEGITVGLIVREDEVNENSGIDYSSLIKVGGEFSFNKKIHHKFCVIDGKNIITGSYNWTNQARLNHEDLTLIRGDIQTAAMLVTKYYYIKEPFNSLKRSSLKDTNEIAIKEGTERRGRRSERNTGIFAKMKEREKLKNELELKKKAEQGQSEEDKTSTSEVKS